ncbi:glutamate 5-kinase [Varunaivibrio sulfuroxidans]|uniref:Glutamate 5-kinase n=1 Tax=Varunaivibrio sulfuroxidans TaxID=1773489 RepID=A0A4R3J682_9PROT|nr:glutamate 5-kinase [Varunaivibrio sulfuroxidans]TCS60867.1 glutamate 5-kinase [Varunaivibrio sulfuroxidans]WES31720.1 glutamate 5-kinase [Varunaivibrio sulfuroxidans]
MGASGDTSSIATARRIVVKIGSALLVDDETGAVHRKWLAALADDVARLRARGQDVLIVSSGAVAVGRRRLKMQTQALVLEDKQAAAAIGMVRLAHAYQESLAQHDLTVAQVLLTLDDTENRRRYINARNTLNALLRHGAVPIINENDTVATDEIRFGDNDRLAARVAAMLGADVLVLLSDVDGLYSADPLSDPNARFFPEIRKITPDIEAMAGQARQGVGTGGMVTKLAAAKICLDNGCRMAIAPGKPLGPLTRIEEGARATWFVPEATPKTARKRWIAASLKPVGALVVDGGARRALEAGKSLLPAGVIAVEGVFMRGDAVVVKTEDGREIARGLMAYPSHDATKIVRLHSADIEARIGYRGRDEMIHRDDLVLT